MRRRDFLKTGAVLAATTELAANKAHSFVQSHNWSGYDFGSGPPVTDRLNQGPFPQYPTDAVIPTDDVVMTTTPSEEIVPNYGKGLITYITPTAAPKKSNPTTCSRPSKTSFDFRWDNNSIFVRHGARCSRIRDASSCLIM
jgi:hypothetical protein